MKSDKDNLLTSMVLMLLVIQFITDTAQAVKIINLQVPPRAIAGGETILSCIYQLGDDNLYSIKWYKDGREFYRYLPSHLERGMSSPFRYFETPGIQIDVRRSSASVVSLVNLTLAASGAYRCEVSGEAPLFATDAAVGFLNVYQAPEIPPEILGLRPYYKPGERLSAKCLIYGTHPEFNLQWFLNGEPVHKQYSKGPYRRVSIVRDNTIDTVIQLSFLVLHYDFIDGNLTVKCVASLSPVYKSETTRNVQLVTEQNLDILNQDLVTEKEDVPTTPMNSESKNTDSDE